MKLACASPGLMNIKALLLLLVAEPGVQQLLVGAGSGAAALAGVGAGAAEGPAELLRAMGAGGMVLVGVAVVVEGL